MSGNQKNRHSIPVLLWVIVVLNLAIGVFSFTYNVAKDDRLVYVDAVKLISKYVGMEAARSELALKSQQWQANLDTLKAEVQKSVAEYERLKSNLSEREDQLMRQLISTQQEKLANYEQTVSDQYKRSDEELSKKILEEVNTYIKNYGERNGYTIILAATHYGNIAYADKTLDITDRVLEGLNKNYSLRK